MPLVTQTGFKSSFQGEAIDKGTVAEPTGELEWCAGASDSSRIQNL
jgi:hypothetical protein